MFLKKGPNVGIEDARLVHRTNNRIPIQGAEATVGVGACEKLGL